MLYKTKSEYYEHYKMILPVIHGCHWIPFDSSKTPCFIYEKTLSRPGKLFEIDTSINILDDMRWETRTEGRLLERDASNFLDIVKIYFVDLQKPSLKGKRPSMNILVSEFYKIYVRVSYRCYYF